MNLIVPSEQLQFHLSKNLAREHFLVGLSSMLTNYGYGYVVFVYIIRILMNVAQLRNISFVVFTFIIVLKNNVLLRVEERLWS